MRPGRHQHGFTLVELVLTVVIIGVVVAFGIPSFQSFMQQSRVKSGAQSLFSALVYARSEALKRNEPVYVYPNGGNWSDGWAITPEKDNKDCLSDATNCLRIQQGLPNVSLTTAVDEVVYRGSGEVKATASFDVCGADDSTATRKQQISVDLTGRPVIKEKGTCS